MGNRANFVVVENQDWQLYHSQWAGCRILDALIGGPELALRYARALRPRTKNEWIDPLWADGGAVVDRDRRQLLFFGDELMVDMVQRRAVLSVLDALWPDYAISWAYDGTAELAAYLGVTLPLDTWDEPPALRLADDPNTLCDLVSVVDTAGRLRMWPLWYFGPAWYGPMLLAKLPGRGVARLTLGKIPAGGVHVDVGQKTVSTWQTADTTGIFRAIPGLWSGWQTECWQDRFEEQVLRCNGALRVPGVDLPAGASEVQAAIYHRVFQADSPAGRLVKLAKHLAAVAPGILVGKAAVADGAARPTEAEWTRFVDACAELDSYQAESA